MRRLVPVLAAALILAHAGRAAADPRWWWDDVRITNTPTDSVTPHVISPGYATGGAGGNGVFVTWSEVDPVGGDLEVWMTASFTAGCSFCPPVRLTDDDDDDVTPRIAVLALPEGFWSIAVIFTSLGTGETTIAWDSTHVSYRVPPEELCGQLASMGPAVIADDQYVRFGGVDAYGSSPDITQASTPLWGHFHATWREDTLGGPVIAYAHDLDSRGGAGWQRHPVRTWGLANPLEVMIDSPRIAADTMTDPDPVSGANTGDRSGVNLVYSRTREVGPAVLSEIVSLRSTDSGMTFSADGARADGMPGVVSDPTSGQVARPALDSAFSSFSTTNPAWVATAWEHHPSGGGLDVLADERFIAQPAAPLPNWQSPGETRVVAPSGRDDGRPTIALRNSFNGPYPAWLAWQQEVGGISDVVSRAGMLSAAAPAPLDLDAYPIAPVRPLDSAISRDVQLSHCVVDEATFGCLPTRTAGDAREPALDANEMAVYAVWSDSRDGNREIYFKRTDEWVQPVTPTLASGCGAAGDAWVDVTFPLSSSCPASPFAERMLRYRIYWRQGAAGPWANAATPIEILQAGEPGPSVTRRITGLLPGTTYRVIVVPEDQARNVSPSDFDPSVVPASPPFSEVAVDTPSPCAAVEPCLWRLDVTSVSPHVPARELVYLVPPSADDIHLQGAAYDCPVATGDLEPDGNAYFNGVPLVMYQVNRPIGTLRLVRSGTTIRFTF